MKIVFRCSIAACVVLAAAAMAESSNPAGYPQRSVRLVATFTEPGPVFYRTGMAGC